MVDTSSDRGSSKTIHGLRGPTLSKPLADSCVVGISGSLTAGLHMDTEFCLQLSPMGIKHQVRPMPRIRLL